MTRMISTIIGVVCLLSALTHASAIPSSDATNADTCADAQHLNNGQTCCHSGGVSIDIANGWKNTLNNEGDQVYRAPYVVTDVNHDYQTIFSGPGTPGLLGWSLNPGGLSVTHAVATQLARGLQDIIDKCQVPGSGVVSGRASVFGDGDFILNLS
ncbi:hypothetical protein N431DRAFT_464241 [Stipitochalara longipes BDJ]|nr:hypothetical protein N431DRAFT_464241 [Stipitochalara longipes BDJ]